MSPSKDEWTGTTPSVSGHHASFLLLKELELSLKPGACGTEPELGNQNPEHGAQHRESESEV